jgi:sugar phosphate isomerase/epimerase
MTTQTSSSARSIESFRGDFEGLAAVMAESWGENASTPFLYTAPFLASLFEYPGAGFELAPAVYHGSELVAFAAGFPRTVVVDGREARVLVVALLTAASAHKSAGYGIVVWSELVRRARDAGFDGVVNYCVEGEAMDRMIVGCCRRLRIPVEKVRTIEYRSRLLPRATGLPAPAVPGDAAQALTEAAAEMTSGVAIRRLLASEEAEWQCTRHGAVTALDRPRDGAPALLTGYVMPIANRERTPCLVVEDVFWGTLGDDARRGLVRELVARAAAAGARIAVLPELGYASLEPFAAERFRPSGQTIHVYLSLWSRDVHVDAPASLYLDVF